MNTAVFPRTEVGGTSLSRMIIGTNWLLGWSHTSQSADRMIHERYPTYQSMLPVFEAYSQYSIDTVMGPASQCQILSDAVKYAQERLGRRFIIIDTPVVCVDDSAKGRFEAQTAFQKSAECGAAICMIHHSSIERLVNRQTSSIDRITDYTYMIREAGMIPGATAHMPEVLLYADHNNYDLQTYVQIFNPFGFMMQVEIESIAMLIHNAKKPVITIKSMAAGRCTPYVGLTFAWNCIRPRDMVAVGCFCPGEVHEDVEISLAALEHRIPALKRRSSPNPNQSALQSTQAD